ncbi:hypothetical protein GCM10010365_20980 [Streptomyces poonensis]|uniref:Uncharacterized protein n=1 Tax=Streptomyces poonensis TaxID=68255 RepID=A0A918PDW8_9ACTN|nr:hypothetical protein GCM10010365_20980 [Streptomyces poonensis]GLJ93505.1 hypothetical protein GCM10017589_61190 [Streptomyces poonensis]
MPGQPAHAGRQPGPGWKENKPCSAPHNSGPAAQARPRRPGRAGPADTGPAVGRNAGATQTLHILGVGPAARAAARPPPARPSDTEALPSDTPARGSRKQFRAVATR